MEREGRACDVAGQRGGAHVILAEALQRRRPVRRLRVARHVSAREPHRTRQEREAPVQRARTPAPQSSEPARCCRAVAAAAPRLRRGRPAARRRGRRPRAPHAKTTTRGPSRRAATPAERVAHSGSAAAATLRSCGAGAPARAPAGRQNGARVGFWEARRRSAPLRPRDPRRHRRARCGARPRPLREGRAWRRHGEPQASKRATASSMHDASFSGGTPARGAPPPAPAARDISEARRRGSPAGSDGRRSLGRPRFSALCRAGNGASVSGEPHIWRGVLRSAACGGWRVSASDSGKRGLARGSIIRCRSEKKHVVVSPYDTRSRQGAGGGGTRVTPVRRRSGALRWRR